MTRDTLIYLAITRGKNRLEVSGSFELYQDFLRASLPALTATTIYNPADSADEIWTKTEGDKTNERTAE